MKLHFEDPYSNDHLAYQRQAIDAVADLFRGQETGRTEFTVTLRADDGPQGALGLAENDLGIGNRLRLLDDEILANLNEVQIRNGLRPSGSLASGDFTIEMETGTGKTYVYLRTIFELNRRYGFTKFVVVVPSVAIAGRAAGRDCERTRHRSRGRACRSARRTWRSGRAACRRRRRRPPRR